MAERFECVIGVLGAPLSGKGLFAKQWITSPWSGLRLVFSPKESSDKYAEALDVRPAYSIAAMVAQLNAGVRSVVLVPSLEPARDRDGLREIDRQFDRFCRCCMVVGGARVLVDELSRVTSASYSPPAWRNISTAGSHDSLEVMGLAQRPALIDKDFLGGCTQIRCYWIKRPSDRRAAVDEMPGGEPPVTIEELAALPHLHYVHWHKPNRVERGVQAGPPGARAARPSAKKSRPGRAGRRPKTP